MRDCLSPFFRYPSSLGIPPAGVSDALVDAYLAHRRETGFDLPTTQLRDDPALEQAAGERPAGLGSRSASPNMQPGPGALRGRRSPKA